MNLRFNKHELLFDISNSISPEQNAAPEFMDHSGIGLKNVKRRLDLIYPGKHRLTIQQDDDQFRVKLQLNLVEHKISEQEAVPMELSMG